MALAEKSKPRLRNLPPLILHPFSDATGPGRLVESSRASLMLQGLLPSGDLGTNELERRLLDGRYCEMRMLFYVGRDLLRWIEQCQEFAQADEAIRGAGYGMASFANFLVESTPAKVVSKLKAWGVADYRAIFMRSLALNTMFADVPDRFQLSDEFIRHYYRYADHIYFARLQATVFTPVPDDLFDFDLFASGEYTRMLEKEFGGE